VRQILSRVCCLALALCGSAAFADTALQSGVPVQLTLPSSYYLTNYYIDVGSAAQQLRVDVAASGGDVDLFVRCGSPFPAQGAQAVDEEMLFRYAQYHSISSTSNESILVLPSGHVPLFCPSGRWYIAAINSSPSAASGTLTATTANTLPTGSIAVDFTHASTDPNDHTNDCDTDFWTDATAAAPIGGNTGTTLGQQRKNALTYATQQLAQQLNLHTTITVHACGAHLDGDANSAILAHAAPIYYFFDSPEFPFNSVPQKYTWYPAAAIGNLNGTSLCGAIGTDCDDVSNAEIEITFNEDVGQSTIIGGENFYLGFASGPASSIDFITVAMHEMTHGLGFFGLANTDPAAGPIGAKAGIDTQANAIAYTNVDDGPYDDIYDVNVAIVNGSTYTPFMGYEVNGSGDAARAAALVSGPTVTSAGTYTPGVYTGLRWFDPEAVASSVNIHRAEAAPNDFPSLYAPCDKSMTATCATQPASTLSHTVQANDMMNAYYSRFNLRNMGLAAPMLGPVGWSTAATAMPAFTQPIPSNWFDRTHGGHGFDFELGYHDATFGDVYFLVFYTYDSAGVPEWYEAIGRLIDGVFVPDIQSNGSTLYRLVYTNTVEGQVAFHADSVAGSIVVDFNQSANAPVCRNVDRNGATQLGVMAWAIGSESGTWCVEQLVPTSLHGQPDYTGHWYAGQPPTNDGGWGFELLDVPNGTSAGSPLTLIAYVYYPGPNGQPTWATASGAYGSGTVTMDLLQVSNGFCRSCTPPAQLSGTKIGSMSLSFDPPNPGRGYTTGTASITANYPGAGGFNRNNIPISMLSVPTGQ